MAFVAVTGTAADSLTEKLRLLELQNRKLLRRLNEQD